LKQFIGIYLKTIHLNLVENSGCVPKDLKQFFEFILKQWSFYKEGERKNISQSERN
jgi:hypothetical protein